MRQSPQKTTTAVKQSVNETKLLVMNWKINWIISLGRDSFFSSSAETTQPNSVRDVVQLSQIQILATFEATQQPITTIRLTRFSCSLFFRRTWAASLSSMCGIGPLRKNTCRQNHFVYFVYFISHSNRPVWQKVTLPAHRSLWSTSVSSCGGKVVHALCLSRRHGRLRFSDKLPLR